MTVQPPLTPGTAMWTDIGGREEQQDRVAVFEREGVQLLVVADGLGGHEGGALAAQAVVDAARARGGGPAAGPEGTQSHLAAIVADAHSRINEIDIGLGSESPHSTCVLFRVADGVATWAHVGDSRLYRLENGRIVERTIDHSVVEMMRAQGRLTEEEMATHPDQNRLYEALGGPQAPTPDFGSRVLASDDAFLLVSDGVWEHSSTQQMEDALCGADLQAALRGLVVSARAGGGPRCDNLAAAGWRWRRPRKARLPWLTGRQRKDA